MKAESLEKRIVELEKLLGQSSNNVKVRPREEWEIIEDAMRDEIHKNSFTSGHYRGRGAY